MRTAIFILSLIAFTGCAVKDQAPQTPEAPAPKVVWAARADKAVASFGSSELFGAIAVSPQGDRILSGDWEGRVLLWEIANGALAREFQSRAKRITAAAFDESGAIVFSAGDDLAIRSFDAASGKQIRRFSGHKKPIAAIAVGGEILLSADEGGVIRLWNIKTGKQIRQIKDGRSAIGALAVSQNRIVRGGADGLIKIYHLKSGKLLQTLKGHKGRIYALAAQNGDIYSGGADGTIRVWNLANGKQKLALKAPAAVRAIAVQKERLVSGGDDMIARFWDLTGGEETHSFPTNAGGVNALAFSGDLVASASAEIQLFSAIDPRGIGFDQIVLAAGGLAEREHKSAIASGEPPEALQTPQELEAKRLAALEKALSIYWGDPSLADLVYNDENQSVSGFVRSFYGGFSRKVEFEIAQDDAFELFYNPSYDPRVTFVVKDGALVLDEITIKDAWGEQTRVKIIDGENEPLIIAPFIAPLIAPLEEKAPAGSPAPAGESAIADEGIK
ncbi:MAG: WD40 repeat domain-containing protein [Helicobacteraceae bacterium]|jgi:hypothetical protein|nr:WD40 repeat domain-containing protein [Helicobacteraceae bacterium]